MNSDIWRDFVNNNFSNITSSSVIFNYFHFCILCSIFILHFVFDVFSLIVCDSICFYTPIQRIEFLLFMSEMSKTCFPSVKMYLRIFLTINISSMFFSDFALHFHCLFFSNRGCCSTVVLCFISVIL